MCADSEKNKLALKFWEVVHQKNLRIRCNLVPSAANIADQVSRKFKDAWDFSLDKKVFMEMCHFLNFNPLRDMFSSRNCHLLKSFVGVVKWILHLQLSIHCFFIYDISANRLNPFPFRPRRIAFNKGVGLAFVEKEEVVGG